MKINIEGMDKTATKECAPLLVKLHRHIKEQGLKPNFYLGSPGFISVTDKKGNFSVEVVRKFSGEVWLLNENRADPHAKKNLLKGKEFYKKLMKAFIYFGKNKSFDGYNLKEFTHK